MFTNAKALVVIAACAFVAHAQSTNGTSTTATAPASQTSLPPGLDSCILGCVTSAAAGAGCSGISDLPCVCTSSAFQQAAGSCIQSSCPSSDIQAAMQLQQQECAAFATGMSSGMATGVSTGATTGATTRATTGASTAAASTAASTPKSSATSASASPSQPATSSSAAMALSAPFSLGGLVGALVASAGALVGGAFVL